MARAILDGARFGSGDQAMAWADARVVDAYEAHGYICQLRHVGDGTHEDGSLHYIGHARKYSLIDIPEETREAIFRDVREATRADDPYSDFDVVYDREAHAQHLAIKWQPKRAMNR